jgi:hypothetical protein
MSFLSALDSALSYIGFMFGAPSISAPWDAPLRGEYSPTDKLEVPRQSAIEEDTGWSVKPQRYHLDDLHAGLGMETAGCCDDPAPGSGQLDCFGDFA